MPLCSKTNLAVFRSKLGNKKVKAHRLRGHPKVQLNSSFNFSIIMIDYNSSLYPSSVPTI
ncbi:MAG: hypothetical protein ACTS77_03020 [Arsenophonus sp. NC-TX2-MAG3]